MQNQGVTEVTRRSIFDFLGISGIAWSGRLEETEFLSRLYDLTTLPSTDDRFKTALGDIRQHRNNWNDWADDWVLHDPRVNLLNVCDEEFLRFLCETIHPVVRVDGDEVQTLLDLYNRHLSNDGWALVEAEQISGKPIFTASKEGQRLLVFDEPTAWQKVERQIQQARDGIRAAETEEQYQAVGLFCREALISVAQEVYDANIHVPSDGSDPSKTDANRMLEGFFNVELPGSANTETRAYARSALKLAVALQHKRTADFRTSALCLEATASTINIVSVLAGERRRI